MAITINGSGTITGVTAQDELNVDSNTLVVDSTNDRVGIGTSSPETALNLGFSGADDVNTLRIAGSNGSSERFAFDLQADGANSAAKFLIGSGGGTSTEKMRIDSSGNLSVGTTSAVTPSGTSAGCTINNAGYLVATRSLSDATDSVAYFNRLTSNGEIISFRKNGNETGKIYTEGDAIELIGSSNYCRIGANGNAGLSFYQALTCALPWNGSTRSLTDDVMNLGLGAHRFNDIYATNTSIQTSDQNEKQQIASLTDAEMNVAKRLSALFKTFKWNSAVEEKGDNARTHSGIIAQDMQQAFTDEGLDAGNYAMFISSTWWEKEISVDAVEEETDEEGNVITEGQDAYTYMDSKYEATEGYTEKTRLGVRYPELFAFINAYNDQRFEALETRIETLENA